MLFYCIKPDLKFNVAVISSADILKKTILFCFNLQKKKKKVTFDISYKSSARQKPSYIARQIHAYQTNECVTIG